MLSELRISNFAIIEQQALTFDHGLNVISGETGAGKSIVLEALELILGGRASAEFVRTGTKGLEVEALFDLSSLAKRTLESLPDIAYGSDELLISRQVSADGKGKVYINGRMGSVALLNEICGKIINICSQNEHTELLKPSAHRDLVDGYAANAKLLEEYRSLFQAWFDLNQKLTQIKNRVEKSEFRKVELEEAVRELSPLGLKVGLRTELEERVKILGNAERIISELQVAVQQISESQGISEQVRVLVAHLRALSRLDSQVTTVASQVELLLESLSEIESNLNSRLTEIEVDGDGLTQLRDVLAEVARLQRKYKTDEAGLLKILEESQIELKNVSDVDLLKLAKEVTEKLTIVKVKAAELRRVREKAAKKLCDEVARELADLNLAGAKLEVRFEDQDLGPDGGERLEILISTNRGEQLRPLRQVASGGELSRIMLVLQKILGSRAGVNVLVFDEVDAGVSGKVARAVGEKLRDLAGSSQVICITHLPQVASLANRHFLVYKSAGQEKRTICQISELDQDQRIEEIARMLSGYQITASARESARELMSSKC